MPSIRLRAAVSQSSRGGLKERAPLNLQYSTCTTMDESVAGFGFQIVSRAFNSPSRVNASCCRPRTTPFPEKKSVLGVIHGVLLWTDMNTATPLGARGRSVISHAIVCARRTHARHTHTHARQSNVSGLQGGVKGHTAAHRRRRVRTCISYPRHLTRSTTRRAC